MDDNHPGEEFSLYISWVKALRCSLSTPLDAPSLVNCRSFAEILHRIDDTFFAEMWVEKIPDYGLDTNWRPKANNLGKLVRKITEYLDEYARRRLAGHVYWNFDDHLFVEAQDVRELNKVMCLIVACAYMGRNKEELVKLITQQPVELQELVMRSVQTVTLHSDDRALVSPDPPDLHEESFQTNGHSEHNGKNGRLARENADLKADKEKLESEVETLKQKIHEISNQPSVDHLGRENDELRKKKMELEDRVMVLEATIEDKTAAVDGKDEELENLKKKMTQIRAFEEDYLKMKDDIGELKSKEHEVQMLTRELEALKKKSKEAAIDRSELTVLREKATKYVEDMVALEDERSKNKTLRQQIGSLKAQKEEKEAEVNKITIRLNKLESELAETKGKLASADKKTDDLVHEKIDLQSQILELEMQTRESLTCLNNLGSELETTKAVNDDHAERARVLDMERELVRLREHLKEMEGLQLEQREWQTTKGRNRELESELSIATAKRADLEATIEQLEKQLENPQAAVDVNHLRVQIEQQSIELGKHRERADMFEKQAATATEAKKRMEDVVNELQKEIAVRGDQLKKAKQLLVDQEHKLASSEDGGPTLHQFETTKKELEQKDKLIKRLEQQIERINTDHEEEQRLMTTSYHEMSQQLNEMSRRESVLDSSRPKSFLKRQMAANTPTLSIAVPWFLFVCSSAVLFCCVFLRDLVRGAPQFV